MAREAFLYIHGKGGSADEAGHYEPLCPKGSAVIGLDYRGQTPWDAAPEICSAFDRLSCECRCVNVIANSLGAYFAMTALAKRQVSQAFFISPVVDMERLIRDMMSRASVDERELRERGEILTDFGETLSWEYYTHVMAHPVSWRGRTHILYGEHDDLVPIEEIRRFAAAHDATLTVMPGGEHWFHTKDQMAFLDAWFLKYACAESEPCMIADDSSGADAARRG